MKTVLVLCFGLTSTSVAFAHGGGLDANGCHTNKKAGEYHCHRAPSIATSPGQSSSNGQTPAKSNKQSLSSGNLPPGCHVGPRGGTYTITKSGKKNYGGC